MKKLIAAAFAVALTGVCLTARAEDAILYWQVPTSGKAVDAGYSYAYLYAQVDGGGNVMLSEQGWAYDTQMASEGKVAEANLSGVDGTINSFFVEYYKENAQLIGKSVAETLMDLVQSGYVKGIQLNPPVEQTGAWSPTPNFTTSIPEPTSGLLMLIGLAGLALRRKRA